MRRHNVSWKRWLPGLPVSKIWLIVGHGVERPGDLDIWPLVCNVTRGTDNLPVSFGASATFLCRVVGKHRFACNWRLTDVILTMWRYNLDLWPLTSPRSDEGYHACSICRPSLKFVGLPFPKVWLIFGHGLVTLTFDLSICKWGHGSPMTWGFLPANFQLAMPFHSRLRAKHGTDRKIIGHECITPDGAGA